MNRRVVQLRKRISRFSLVVLSAMIRMFSLLVPYRAGVAAGGFIGLMGYYVLRRERDRAIAHLTQVFGEKDATWVRRTARRCFIHLGKALLEVMMMSRRRLARAVVVKGEECLQAAVKQGKGVIFATAHIGNWEMMGHAVASRHPLSVVAAPIEPERLNDMIVSLRAGMGVKTIVRGRPGASRELIRTFKENRVLGILIDQDTDVESAFVDFMGRPAWTPIAAAAMAAKFDAPLLFGYILRGRGGKHTVTIEGPLQLIKSDDRERDIVANTAMLTKKIEDCIRAVPEQWVWMHRRWRRQP